MASDPTTQPEKRPDRVLYNYVFRSMKRAHDMFAHDRDKFVEGDSKA